MSEEGKLGRAFESTAVPGRDAAEERAWEVIRRAYGDRTPTPHRRPAFVRPLLAGAALAAVAAAALSPPGRALVGEVREAIGVEQARPSLFRLPTAGRLLVDSEAGSWVVRSDGSKRLLGSTWREASWSPGGRYVVTVAGDELAALEPDGDVRWKLARPRVRLARWGGTRVDTRVAYLSGAELRVVAGDGSADRRLARPVLAVAPAWRPGRRHVLAWVGAGGEVVAAKADSQRILWTRRAGSVRRLEWSRDGRRLLVQGLRSLLVLDGRGRVRLRLLGREAAPVSTAALSPSGTAVAFVQKARGRSSLWVVPRLRPDGSAARRVFAGAGSFRDLAWSPDGRWLLVGWREADQWVFIRSARVRRIEAVSGITAQFDSTRFPRVAGWCCG